ncbi:WLM-domain-containing protein [Poronia punctata]|nr:WLM-domain-containing protein [Poronia punctata]
MREVDPLILSYSHLANFPRADEALRILKRVASLVKPLMRARGWKVGQLTEFYPVNTGHAILLGLNVNRGQKICLRLREPGDQRQFISFEKIADTMLHELAHIVHGPHDAKFHALWYQLRDEHFSLALKGYTGENFLSEGHRLGGSGGNIPIPNMHEARRLARERNAAASGRRLGGARTDKDLRTIMRDAAERRRKGIVQGCANDHQTQAEIVEIADTATRNGFGTKAEEDAANEVAIAQALWELVQEEEEEERKKMKKISPGPLSGSDCAWTCAVCTLVNPEKFLCCEACGSERSEKEKTSSSSSSQRVVIDLTTESDDTDNVSQRQSSSSRAGQAAPPPPQISKSRTWTCHACGRVRESQWWSCDLCGTIKLSS